MHAFLAALRRCSVRGLTALAVLCLVGCLPSPTDPLFTLTGEDELLPQVRALFQTVGNVVRPTPRTAPYVPVEHAGVNP
ncbi:MAG: hypothetical protein PVI59_07530, partial [Anaerolineae bacterium]